MNRQNDPDLHGDLVVFRRIPPHPDHVQWTDDGLPEPASQNFKDRRRELSVHLASEATAEKMLAGHEGFGLVEIPLQAIREVFRDAEKPLVICRDDEDPANGHVLVCGDITNGMAKKIRRAARWVDGRWPTRAVPE